MKWKRVVVALSLIALMTSLFSADLEDIIREAKEQSSTMRMIEHSRESSDLSIASKDLKNRVGVGVNSSFSLLESNYGAMLVEDYRYTLSGEPSVSLVLPNDGGTTIKLVAPFSTTLQGDPIWSTSPNIGATHTFKFGDSGETLDDLTTTRQRLELDRSYTQKILDFETSVYNKILELIGYEITLLRGEKNILIAQTKLDNALKLKTVTVGSTAHQSMELSLKQLQNTKKGTQDLLALSKVQYKQLTGLEWEGVEIIREPSLEFSPLPTGDTTVILAALDEQIARENLALTQRLTVNSTSVPSLSVGGDVGFSYSQKTTSSSSYTITPRATYNGSNFSVGTSVKLGIDGESGKVTPVVTVSGGWQNNATKESEEIKIRKLEQEIEMATLSYQGALLDYQIKANKLEGDILSFTLERDQFEDNSNYNKEVLEKTIEAFNRGLATQTEVDQALLDVELDRYEAKRYALQALILANRVEALKL